MRGLPAPREKAKNTIKTKCSSVFFSSVVSVIAWWLASLLFWSRLSDGWPGHWWCSVDGLRGCCWLVKMILVERADKLLKVLNGQ